MAGSVSRLFNRTLVKIAEPHINQTVARITGNPPARNKTTGNSYADFEPRRQMLQRAEEERRASFAAGGPYLSKAQIKMRESKREKNWLAATQVDREAKDPYLVAARKAEEELCRKLPADADVSEKTLGNFCKIKFGYPSERSKQMKEREENWLVATQNDRKAMEPFDEAGRKAEQELCRKLPADADVSENTLGNFCKINYPSEKSEHL